MPWGPPRICCWSEKESMPLHIDKNEKNNMNYSCIGYLNDSYKGGSLFFDNGFEIKPKENSLIFFKSDSICHGVKEIITGKRYTIPAWFSEIRL
jgi:predicted 2-oxoglutarate/Fe(II)-dependent dioxygenase YbiX